MVPPEIILSDIIDIHTYAKATLLSDLIELNGESTTDASPAIQQVRHRLRKFYLKEIG